MSNWWDFGIKGKDFNVPCSSGITYPSGSLFRNLNNYVPFKTISITESDSVDYPVFTTQSGTQLYCHITRTRTSTGTPVYRPNESVNIFEYKSSFYLKKGGTTASFGTTYNFCNIIGGTLSIYDYFYRSTSADPYVNGRVRTAVGCFPRDKQSGGGTQHIAVTSADDGLHFHKVAFPFTLTTGYEFSAYIEDVGFLPASFLNNQFWFDPSTDALDEEDVPTGDTGDRPINKKYPSDDIDFPDLPSVSPMLAFGRMKMFNPTATQLGDALDILWTDATESTLEQIVESCKKWWYKPEQYCVSIMATPVTPSTSGSSNILFGKYDTHTTANVVSSQWAVVDCGSLTVPLMYGSYLDYSLTQAMLFLPYIGFRPINVKECLGGTIHIKYYIDLFSGSGVCFVKVSNQGSSNSVLYNYECSVNTQIPITSNNYNNMISAIQKTTTDVINTAVNKRISTDDLIKLGSDALDIGHDFNSPTIVQSGHLTSNTGLLSNEKPYIVIHFPVSVEDNQYSKLNGKTSASSVTVGSVSGYNKFSVIHLDNISLPKEVLQEVESIFQSGVII